MSPRVWVALVAGLALSWAIDVRSDAAPAAPGTPVLAPRVSVPAPRTPVPAPRASARSAATPNAAESQAEFQAVVQPLLEETCSQCHNPDDADGGLDVSQLMNVSTLSSARAGWEQVLGKLRSGEMPPSGIERRQDRIDAAIRFLDAELARVDENAAPDPGRVTVRRLNRAEYTNTIRDLLGVEFRADKAFPADDSGDGFDNIGDVLTISPVLMEKYLSAAERISERALGAEPLPSPVKVEYSLKLENLRRLNPSTAEATHHIDFDADYDLVVGMIGQRPEGAKPVKLGVWVDGKLASTRQVETKPSGLVYIEPYSEERIRISLPEGDHTVRLGFMRDDFVKTLPEQSLYERKSNKWVGYLGIVGPFASKQAKPSRNRVLVCDPGRGPACVDEILTKLARRAYRRPVSKAEVAELSTFVGLATADGRSVEQGIALALQAMLVSPHFLFHVEHDRFPADPSQVHPISDVELASRLSYFLWSSMPDDELSALASAGTLSRPAVLDAQVKRMLRDPRANALAENFAGQWLEIRNLDTIKPDPDKFPVWVPELREAMRTETELFFSSILRNNRSIGEFIDARYTFLNDTLANYYGVGGVQGPEFRRVALTTDERGGVLGHASVLAVSSYPTRTSVVIRGKYILQNILGAPPPPPPADVPSLDEQAVATSASLRLQMETHRSNAVCASCHARMDPLGFSLEHFDALGQWRTVDGESPINSNGVLLDGTTIDGPAALRRALLAQREQFVRAVAAKLLTYATGREIEYGDAPAIRGIVRAAAADDYRWSSTILAIVKSPPFQMRRSRS